MYRIDYCQGLCGPFPNYRADSWTIARFVLSLVNGTLGNDNDHMRNL